MLCRCGPSQEGGMSFSDPSLNANQVPTSISFTGDDQLNRDHLTQAYRRLAASSNTKELGTYMPYETATNQQYFVANDTTKTRNTYRKVINFGALPNAATKTVAHGIPFTSQYQMMRIYGAATDPVTLQYIPLPYTNVSMYATGTNVVVSTTSDWTNFTLCTIVLEYAKNLT